MRFRMIFFLISGLFVSSLHAADMSIMDEIKNCDAQIQKINEQLSLQETKAGNNSRDIKYLTEKKNKLMINKLKKMVDLKNNLQKYSNDIKIKIEKSSAKKKNNEDDKILEKLKTDQQKYEDEIKRLNTEIVSCEAEIKKSVDHKDKNKNEADKKKCSSLSSRQNII